MIERTEPSSPLILASQSPRRAQLLQTMGVAFEVIPSIDEEPGPDHWPASPAAFAESASHFKACSVAVLHPDRFILAGDTVVACGGQIIGKPVDREDARQILTTLFDTTHEVITGVTLSPPRPGCRQVGHAVTVARMRAMSERELADYLDRGQWAGKAGAYGIQDHGDAFVTLIEGGFNNVVGLPTDLVAAMLGEAGFDVSPG